MKLSLLLIYLTFSVSSSYKILGVFPSGSKSHYAIGEATMKALHDAGHEVTMISVFELKKPSQNYTQIRIRDFLETMVETDDKFNAFEMAKMSPLASLSFLFNFGAAQVEHVLTSESVQVLLGSKEKFDLVIVEVFVIEALLGFGQHFNCPIIGVNTFDAVYWNDVYTGNNAPLSYVPNVFLGLPDHMTFAQRLSNTIYSQIERFAYTFYSLRNQRKLYEKHFPKATKSFEEVCKSISVLFMNSHTSSSSPRPLLRNMIEISGIHIAPAKPLPDNIKEFLDSAADGVVLFSMGSFVKSTDWTVQQREAFLKTFSKLKQKVLWKYENETLPGNPGNIMIGSWIPQRDIIAHPNVKVFITHGGNLGTTEALSEGVPLLGIPFFGDQMMNIQRAVVKGYALTVDFRNITEESFSKTLNELLNNPKYGNKAKELSRIFKDRPMTPKETVVFWSEHVIRHNGADYLKAEGRNLSYIEFNLIDIYVTLVIITIVIFYIFYKIFKYILGILRKSPKKRKNE